jgi:FkbM family methyltransferase
LAGCRWTVGSSNHGCWLGSYELVKQCAIAASLEPGKVLFDIGANVGFYSLLGSRIVGPSGRVYAFEPVPTNVVQLKRHLEINACTNVTVLGAAVGDREGIASFDDSVGLSMGHLAPCGPLTVRIVTLDSLVQSGQIPMPDVVKLDVEGAEAQVLSGAERLLKARGPKIFLAVHGEKTKKECIERLLRLGYGVVSLGIKPLEESEELVAERSHAGDAQGGSRVSLVAPADETQRPLPIA